MATEGGGRHFPSTAVWEEKGVTPIVLSAGGPDKGQKSPCPAPERRPASVLAWVNEAFACLNGRSLKIAPTRVENLETGPPSGVGGWSGQAAMRQSREPGARSW
jgi:hypothetical protein